MYKITVQDQANSAASEWLRQRSGLDARDYKFTMSIYEKLLALGETPNPNDVNKVIGNDSWTKLLCGTCKKSVDTVMSSTEEYSEVNGSVRICLDCLEKSQNANLNL